MPAQSSPSEMLSGDNDPNVYGDGDNTIKIVVSNEKYECLIGDIV